MIVRVLQYAFGEGEVREVQLPENPQGVASDTAAAVLEEVFYWGQNDHQNVADRYSVSMGDVAELWGKHYLCCSVGWKELSESGYEAYKKLSREGRLLLLLRNDELLLGAKELTESQKQLHVEKLADDMEKGLWKITPSLGEHP